MLFTAPRGLTGGLVIDLEAGAFRECQPEGQNQYAAEFAFGWRVEFDGENTLAIGGQTGPHRRAARLSRRFASKPGHGHTPLETAWREQEGLGADAAW